MGSGPHPGEGTFELADWFISPDPFFIVLASPFLVAVFAFRHMLKISSVSSPSLCEAWDVLPLILNPRAIIAQFLEPVLNFWETREWSRRCVPGAGGEEGSDVCMAMANEVCLPRTTASRSMAAPVSVERRP